MEGRDDRHRQPRQQRQDMAAGFTAKNAEFMLKANDFESGRIEEVGGARIFPDPFVMDLNAGAISLEENCCASKRVHRSDPSVTLEEKNPGLDLRIELPARFRRQIDPLKHEMRARDEQGSMVAEALRFGLALDGSYICDR